MLGGFKNPCYNAAKNLKEASNHECSSSKIKTG